MEVSSAFTTAQQGLANANQGIERAASNIARASSNDDKQVEREQVSEQQLESNRPAPPTPEARPQVNLTEETVNLRVEQFNAQANVRSLQSADEVLGTLIDVRV
jgi:flagellar basal body rod protein FlgC